MGKTSERLSVGSNISANSERLDPIKLMRSGRVSAGLAVIAVVSWSLTGGKVTTSLHVYDAYLP